MVEGIAGQAIAVDAANLFQPALRAFGLGDRDRAVPGRRAARSCSMA